jgi:hypothetical protein
MAKLALLVELKAKPGKESEVEAFLEKEATLVRGHYGRSSRSGSGLSRLHAAGSRNGSVQRRITHHGH